jgi:hypothetical protein
MSPKKEIIYPFFLECVQFCSNSFWEEIFEELAYGKCPSGTYISKNFLCCSYKDKKFSYKIERKDPEELYNDVSTLLKNKLGILSQKEKSQRKFMFHELEKTIRDSRQNWSGIRRKNIKDIMYEKYVIDIKKKYQLTIKQSKYLLAVIFVSIMFKIITPKDITYNDNKIQSISGIEFEKGKIILQRPLYIKTESAPLNEMVITEELMSENWETYLNSLKKLQK